MHVFNGTVPMSDLSPAGPKKKNKKRQTSRQADKYRHLENDEIIYSVVSEV